jgi:hypothetical protein
MYIQPYEPRELNVGASSSAGYQAPGTTSTDELGEIDGPWSNALPNFGDAQAALNDGPLGELGLAPMLQNLTGMMQQLVQMMQALLGRMSGGNELRRLPEGSACGCAVPPKS